MSVNDPETNQLLIHSEVGAYAKWRVWCKAHSEDDGKVDSGHLVGVRVCVDATES